MQLKQNYQSKFFKKKFKQNAKQYKASSAAGGLNIAWTEEALHAQWAYWLLRNHSAWVRGYQEWLGALSCWDKKQVVKAQSSSRRKHVSTLTDFKGTAHMFNVKDVLKSFAELELMMFQRSSLPMTLGLAEVAC